MKKNEDSLRDLWDNIKDTDTCFIVYPEGEKKVKGVKNIFENIVAEEFPNLGKETVTQVQEEQSPKEEYTKTHCN